MRSGVHLFYQIALGDRLQGNLVEHNHNVRRSDIRDSIDQPMVDFP
jgi:hypothetical protein